MLNCAAASESCFKLTKTPVLFYRFSDRSSAVANAATVQQGDGRAENAAIKSGAISCFSKSAKAAVASVYMAEQEEPVRRRVALKVIKLGMTRNR